MKNILIVLLAALVFVGFGTSYLLLRLPESDLTVRIVDRLGVKRPAVRATSVVEPRAAEPEVRKAPSVPKAEPPAREAAKETVSEVVAEVKAEDDGKTWKGLSSDNWYAGRKLDEDDFDGKVALVYAWSSKEKPSVTLLSRIEEIHASFKSKPLVVVGSHRGGRNPKIPNAYKKLGLTFPMYEGAAFAKEPSVTHYPYIYIVNHHGKIVYRGSNDRSATEALVNALTACMLKQ